MTRPLRLAATALLCALLGAPGSCQGTGDLSEANSLYDAGRFAEAAASYERARASGLDGADVLYNLGNSYACAHQLGRALAAYRAALRIAPRDRDVRHNLEQVSAQRADLPPTPVSFFSAWADGLLDRVTRNELVTTALLLWWACCALGMAALRGWGRRRRVLAALGAVCVLWALATAATVAAQVRGWGNPPAFIAAEGAQLRSGPGERFEASGTLSDGAQVQIVGRSGMWLELVVGEGRHAWVVRDQVATLDPTGPSAAR
jgi:tetratricopeptide (TPR) repeat protein